MRQICTFIILPFIKIRKFFVFVFREETISLVLVQVVNNKMLVKKLKRMFFSYKKIMYRNFIITKPSNWEMDRDVKSQKSKCQSSYKIYEDHRIFPEIGVKMCDSDEIEWGLKMCDSKADCIRLDRFSSNSTGLILMVDDFLFCLSRVMGLNPMTNSLLQTRIAIASTLP